MSARDPAYGATLTSPTRTVRLAARTRVGRDALDGLSLASPAVSFTHAELAWTGEHWTVRDLHSLRGTRLNGRPLVPGRSTRLSRDDTLDFGDGEVWRLTAVEAPGTFAVNLIDGSIVDPDQGALVLPGPPDTVVYHDPSGWRAERGEVATPLFEGSVVSAGAPWRVHLATPSATLQARALSLADVTLTVGRSPEMEHAWARLGTPLGEIDLGHRAHLLVLYALAEELLRDTETPPASRGWMDCRLLASTCGWEYDSLDTYVSRARAHLVEVGVRDGKEVVDGRRTNNRRLGLPPERVRLER